MEFAGYKQSHIEDSKRFNEWGDCTVMAWSHCFDCEYEKAHAWMKRHGRLHRKGMKLNEIHAALKSCTKARVKFGPYTQKNKIALSKFVKQHPKGRYYVLVRGHALCVKDGVVHDYKDGPRRQVTFAARVYLEGEL